ncbi:hypothetical protein ACF0H5_017666 [Mactra antiquata]
MSSGKRYTFDSIAYPRYYFFQTRLQDLIPRWRRILDTGRLPDCILDGTSTLQDIISDSKYCKHYTNVYLFAEDHFLQEVAADLKLSVEVDKSLLGDVEVDKSLLGDVEVDKSLLGDVKVDKSLLGDVEVDKSLLGDVEVENVSWKEFKDGLKNFHVCQPTAVVMVQPNFDKSNVELLSGLTKEQQDDVIIYNSNSKTSLLYSDLVKVDFNLDNINLSDDRSSFLHGCLSAQIQNVLERKVVSVLASIAQYNRPLVPNPPLEPEKSLYESLYYDVHESLTNQTVITDLFPRPEGKTKTTYEKNAIFQDNLVDFVARKSKCLSCDKLSVTFGIKPQFVNEFLNKGFFNFDGKIRKKVWSLHLPRYEEKGSPSLMLKELESLMFRLGTIFQTIIKEVEKFLLNVMQVFEKLFQLQFEVYGILCLVKVEINVDIPPLRMIQTDLQNDLLDIDGVLGCGTLYGILTLHVEKLLTKQQKKEISEVLELYGHREGYKCQVLKSREEQARGHIIESGQTLRARCLMAVKDPHLYGSLGCFVEMIPRDPNVVEKSKSSEPGAKVSTAFMIKENEVHAITCAHCVKECDNSIDVKTGENFVHFGTKKCEEYFHEVLDVATIAVDPTRQMSCDSKLKRFDAKSFTNQWQYYDGNPCGRQVHKEGSATKFTKGIVISADYASQKFKHYNSYRLRQNILIEPLPDLPEGQSVLAGPIELGDEQFSMKGDSGSVICTDNAEDNSVYIVSLLIGAASAEGKYCYSYSSDFKKTMLELMERYDVEIRPALLTGRTPTGASTP